ncbi:syndetin [Cimex lectularius]|uniref:Coiled-coil domain-containing protein 132 n=1 Tax=Cimex lectularius TaxID=79782 RepID=A0A8I6RXA7_CIMLE|nr:syndetin [Cimex lectularius]
MDELKTKIFDFMHIQVNPKIPIVGGFSTVQQQNAPEPEDAPVRKEKESERPSDQEILEAIDPKHFSMENEFDPGRYELEKFVEMDMSKIEDHLHHLKQQQVVVSNKVLQMILEKQSACQEEFTRITEIQAGLDMILKGVQVGRAELGMATRHFTTASLGILANYRKRTLAQQLLSYLNTIKTLYKTESKLRELLNTGDFPGAIGLLLECQGVASTYKHFSCVAALSMKLKETLEMAEEKLDNTLAEMCCGFEENIYEKLHSAYFLLGKTQIAMDQFPMHFTSAVQTTASSVVRNFIDPGQQNLREMQYSEMCKEVKEENFIPCLLTLCKSLWCIVLSYNKVVAWHHQTSKLTEDSDFETKKNEQKIKQKLNKGFSRLWHDVQTRVSSLVMAANLSLYKIDDFLQVLGILHRLTQIGEEFCESESEEVASSVRAKSSDYFNSYHSARLDDLKVFLENESWTPCPVRCDFSLLHLQEFQNIRLSVEVCAGVKTLPDNSGETSSAGTNFFSRFPNPLAGTPFDSSFQVDSKEENILANIPDDGTGYYSEDSEDDVEISTIDTDSKTKKSICEPNYKGPLLTNTTLTVLRSCGKYLQMSRLLKSISSEVIVAMAQLFEYYLYTINSFFSSDLPDTLCDNFPSLKLQSVLNRIKESLILSDETFHEGDSNTKVYVAQISPIVDLKSPDTVYGLGERIIAVESLIFLAQEYNLLKSYLEKLISPQCSSFVYLNQFYSQTVAVASEIRKSVYACSVWRAIDAKCILSKMSKVDWEVKDVMSQHSEYVDVLWEAIKLFDTRLSVIKTYFIIPKPALDVIWGRLILLICNIFVEGFATSKKCSSGGRALMQLDFIQLISKVQTLCMLSPIPHREFVESYIKAYYQTEDVLETWLKDHKEYSSKQLTALVHCACQSSKKARQKLLLLIEELEKNR